MDTAMILRASELKFEGKIYGITQNKGVQSELEHIMKGMNWQKI
jgi:hypothetical protein